MMVRRYAVACESGVLASLASTFGKLAADSEAVGVACTRAGVEGSLCSHASVVARCVALALVIACNIFMWLLLARALSASSSTVETIAVNMTTNFVFTALSSYVLFGELVTSRWLVGTSLIVVGLWILHSSKRTHHDTVAKKDD